VRTPSASLMALALVLGLGPGGAGAAEADLVPIDFGLPRPEFTGTRKDVKLTAHIEKPSARPRPVFRVPRGTSNVALNRPVTSSDDAPMIGDLEQVTDGDKRGSDGSYVELGPGRHWVQIDLGAPHTLYAILVWHFHGEARIYHDVVVQVADDTDFITNVRTVYNNDYDNSSGLGIGKDLEYFESNEGRLIPVQGLPARHVRLYSKGSIDNDMNHYTEVAVYGKPAK